MTASIAPIRVLVVGLGEMGRDHALAYHNNPGFDIVGLVNRSVQRLPNELQGYQVHADFPAALAELKPDLCAISTYSDSHAEYAIAALEAGCHVFVEKPLATTVADAQRVVAAARRAGRQLMIGYILRHHPSWIRLIEEARKLGGPYVFRMNLNQQSSGRAWDRHKMLLRTTSPIVDCGVHYIDVMCQIADAPPIEVRGMGLRMSDAIAPDMYNYGHLQLLFEDGSIGWFEAGWGPMISDTASFIKDVLSPKGSVSLVSDTNARSGDTGTHSKASVLRLHSAEIGGARQYVEPDWDLTTAYEPNHQELCELQQAVMLEAIRGNIDLDQHMADAVLSLAICIAADQSIRTGQPVKL